MRSRLMPFAALAALFTPAVTSAQEPPHQLSFQGSVFPMNGIPAVGATFRLGHMLGMAQRVSLDGYLTWVPAYDRPSPRLTLFGLSSTYLFSPAGRVTPLVTVGVGIMHVNAAQGVMCVAEPCPSLGDPNFSPAWQQTGLIGGGFQMRLNSGLILRTDTRIHIPLSPESRDRASGDVRPEFALGVISRF
jgi:hypothetical protein